VISNQIDSLVLIWQTFSSNAKHDKLAFLMGNIRPLKDSDRNDILEIARHTWDGHDYLPYFFDSWIEDRNSHAVAIERNGHVVALANLRVIENGRTGWMEGLRVHPDYRGQGLASILTHHVVELANEIPVERIRYTTAVGNETSLHLGETVGMRRKLDFAVHWQDRMDEVMWNSSIRPVKEASIEELSPHLIDAELLPHNVIVYDWKALDVSHDALEKIASLSKFWIQSVDGAIESFSLGFIREDPTGPQWSFTIYARDDSTFLDQLAHHLKMASDAGCKTIFMTYQMDFVETFYSLDWVRLIEDEEMALTLLEKVL
jgi:ribosomal protein S18 acetylase RimI-like enzyme